LSFRLSIIEKKGQKEEQGGGEDAVKSRYKDREKRIGNETSSFYE